MNLFIFLYPIYEYFYQYLLNNQNSINILNECINKRYRLENFKIMYVLYKDSNVYKLNVLDNDLIIHNNYTFKEVMDKKILVNINYILDNIDIKSLVISGFHSMCCVKELAKYAINNNINTMVDLELTEIFFRVIKQDYFNISRYNIDELFKYLYGNSTILTNYYEKVYDKSIFKRVLCPREY